MNGNANKIIVTSSLFNYYPDMNKPPFFTVGMLFFNRTINLYAFTYIGSFDELQEFDPEIDIYFVEEYIKGVAEDIKMCDFKTYSIQSYMHLYCASSFRFTPCWSDMIEFDADVSHTFIPYCKAESLKYLGTSFGNNIDKKFEENLKISVDRFDDSSYNMNMSSVSEISLT